MDEDAMLARFGTRSTGSDLDEIRNILAAHTALERRRQGAGDVLVMKLCCVHLFNGGEPSDTLLIWRAKKSSFDSDLGIDVQLLCGQGLAETEVFLSSERSNDAARALEYLNQCKAAGDFNGFTVDDESEMWDAYYGLRE
ncbi:hypothetical protein [Salininema proteolyticum]|uniref:Uncharacterized protein n=1 Tax=Salininema proteolyticum TaxID=1607685 RepID=A0ABV8U4H1_9ACTN